jgi:hypothetical protein
VGWTSSRKPLIIINISLQYNITSNIRCTIFTFFGLKPETHSRNVQLSNFLP